MLSAGIIVMICGAPLLFIGIILFIIGKKTWKYTAQTTGQVIDMCLNAFSYNRGNSGGMGIGVRTGSMGSNTRCPIYSYFVNGQEYRRAGSVSYNVGHIYRLMRKPVTVYYNPDNPEQSTLGKMTGITFTAIIFSALGGVAMLVGIILLCAGI